MHTLTLYDLLSEVGVGVRILRKKRFVDACVFHLQNLGHSDCGIQLYTIEPRQR